MSDYPPNHPESALWHLYLANNSLAEAIMARGDYHRVNNGVEQTIRYLNEFIGEVKPLPKLTAVEVEFARAAHTYMRKYWDEPLATLIYRAIADSRGIDVWYAFVKGVVKHRKFKIVYREAISEMEEFADNGPESPDSLNMRLFLCMWPEKDFNMMMETFDSDGWVDWEAKDGS